MDHTAPFRWIKHCAIWLSHPYREYDHRRDVRLPADVHVVITAPIGLVEGRSVNVSKGGVCVRAPEPLVLGSVVFLRFPTLDRNGFAYVRRCEARQDTWEIALQFRDGLAIDDRALTGFDYHRISADGIWDDTRA